MPEQDVIRRYGGKLLAKDRQIFGVNGEFPFAA